MKNVGVFCSSSESISPFFLDECERLGENLAKNNFRVIYGGANSGAMGRLAQGVLEECGEIIGIFPEDELAFENPHKNLTQFLNVSSMSERKQLMYRRSDAFLVFPGGLGTLDELFDLLSHQAIHRVNSSPKMNLHSKKIILMNSFQYWDPLVEALQLMIEQNFIAQPLGQMFSIVEPIEDIIQLLKKI